LMDKIKHTNAKKDSPTSVDVFWIAGIKGCF